MLGPSRLREDAYKIGLTVHLIVQKLKEIPKLDVYNHEIRLLN